MSPRARALLAVVGLSIVPLACLALWSLHRPPSTERVSPPAERGTTPGSSRPSAFDPGDLPAAPNAPTTEPKPSALDDARRKVEESAAVARANPKRSRQLLREALAAVPDYEPALQALSLKVFHDENHDEARDLAARCLKVSPDNETCTTVRNYALQRGPEIDAMAAQTEACLAATPKDTKCLATMVAYDVLTGKIDQATRLSDTLESVDPGGKPTLLAKARIASAAGRYEDARHDLDEACRLGMEQACFRAEALRSEGW